MDDMLTGGWDEDLALAASRIERDYTPALPFIQEFENPSRGNLTQSVHIGQYADYTSFYTVHDEIVTEIVSDITAEMSYKIGLSVAALVEATGGNDGKAVGTAFAGDGLAGIVEGQKTQPSPA